MVKFCTYCGAANPPDARFCAKCGNAIQDAVPDLAPVPLPINGPYPATTTERHGINWLWVGAGIGTLLLLGLLYFWLFLSDDMGENDKVPVATESASPQVEVQPTQLFAMTEANIRDKATTVGSNIIGKIPRGSALSGVVKTGEDGSTDWLELAEGKGFVATVNLSETEPPVLTKMLGDKIWSADAAIEIWSKPDSNSALIDRVGAGGKLTLAGLTSNDYIEVKLRRGGVGYIANGSAILARMGGKPIAIAFNPVSCRFGSEIDGQFEKISARLRTESAAIDAKEFPSEEAREKAMNAVEGKSTFQRMQRNYEGLTLTGIALHYEAQSLFFADAPAKVMEVFRAKGFRVGRDGTFPATDIYAGITGTRGEGLAYGKSELGCGV